MHYFTCSSSVKILKYKYFNFVCFDVKISKFVLLAYIRRDLYGIRLSGTLIFKIQRLHLHMLIIFCWRRVSLITTHKHTQRTTFLAYFIYTPGCIMLINWIKYEWIMSARCLSGSSVGWALIPKAKVPRFESWSGHFRSIGININYASLKKKINQLVLIYE